MKKTKDLFIEQRIWESRLELLPYEEEYFYLTDVQNNKRRTRGFMESTSKRDKNKPKI